MRSNWRFLVNPFDKIAGWQSVGIGLLVLCAVVLIGFSSNTYLIGLFNAEVVTDASLLNAFVFQFVSWIYLTLALYIVGVVCAKGVRFQDVLGTVAIARYPYLLMAPIGFIVDKVTLDTFIAAALNNKPYDMDVLMRLLAIATVSIIVLVWYIVLLYNAFKVSTGVKGKKGIWLFILALISSEIIVRMLSYSYTIIVK